MCNTPFPFRKKDPRVRLQLSDTSGKMDIVSTSKINAYAIRTTSVEIDVPSPQLTHRSCSENSNNSQTFRSECDRNTLRKLMTLGCLSSLRSCKKDDRFIDLLIDIEYSFRQVIRLTLNCRLKLAQLQFVKL